MTTDLIARARAGSASAFEELTEPHRRELRVHCYRMLGSFHDAEDVLQETLLAAWQGLATFERRASLRTWLYKIATNRCLNARRGANRRSAKDAIALPMPEPTRLSEVSWLEPFPDARLPGASDERLGPGARYEQTQSMSLTFVAALQVLPHRQLAVLILCDSVGFEASEVAELLESTVDSVNSALKRARANLKQRLSRTAGRMPPPASGSPAEREITAQFVRAWDSANVDALVALLTDDVFVAMPPLPHEYEGRELARRFCANIFREARRFQLVATRANGQPAFAAYLRSTSGLQEGVGLYALALSGDRIGALTRFEPSVFEFFDLPLSRPA